MAGARAKGPSDITGSLVVRVDSLRLELDHQGGDVVLFRQLVYSVELALVGAAAPPVEGVAVVDADLLDLCLVVFRDSILETTVFWDTQLSLFKHVIGIPLLSSKNNYPIAPAT
jgi:hypothetical protein